MKKLTFLLGALLLVFLLFLSSGGSFFSNRKDHLVPRVKNFLNQEVPSKVAKQFNLQYLTSDDKLSGLTPCIWSYSFLSFEKLSAEEGGDLIRKVHQVLYDELSKNPEVSTFFERKKVALSKDQISLKISFWTAEYNRIRPPYIAQVTEVQNCYYYYQAKEDDSLGPLHRFTD